MKPSDLRLCAAKIVLEITDGSSLSECLDPVLKNIADSRDRGFVQAVCYGISRFYYRLDVLLSFLLEKPMNAKDADVHALLLVGLFQLMEMRIPAHAAVSETVNAAAKLKQPWAKGFINAILREYLRNKESLDKKLETEDEAIYSYPDWWINSVRKTWPDNWQAILAAGNEHPPFSLRVNQHLLTRDAYLEKLTSLELAAHPIPHTEQGIVLQDPVPVEQLPGFAQGEVSVQDGAAQLASELLELAPGQKILDACAAPGGKLTHIFELLSNGEKIIGVEKEESRIKLIKENMDRLNFPYSDKTLVCADVANVKKWWDGELFDRILLDAPCSASGVVRRHPDIKLLRQQDDLAAFAKTQLYLLNSLWPLLKPNGLLLYVTCSIFPHENKQVIQQFLQKQPSSMEEKLSVSWGNECAYGRQILPGEDGMDGFYFAKLRKKEI